MSCAAAVEASRIDARQAASGFATGIAGFHVEASRRTMLPRPGLRKPPRRAS
jgi:hypothetical protein